MTCSHPGCRAITREDLAFTAEAARYGQPQRRYVCVMGHSTYTGVPALKAARPPVIPRSRSHVFPKHCVICGEPYLGMRRQLYCSKPCDRAAQQARGTRRGATGPKLSKEALRAARSVTWLGRGRKAVPYAHQRRAW